MSKLFAKRTLIDRLTGSPDLNLEISQKTINEYRKVYANLRKKTLRYLEELGIKKKKEEIKNFELCEYLLKMHENGNLSSSSIRSFRSSLLHHIYEEAEIIFNEGGQISEYIDLYDKARNIIVKDKFAKSDFTNSQSIKFIDKEFYEYCLTELDNILLPSKSELLLKNYLIANIHLGLRPHEWISARPDKSYDSDGNEQKLLVVSNSKNSNQRANGEIRKLILNSLDKKTLISISTIINILSNDVKEFIEVKTNQVSMFEDALDEKKLKDITNEAKRKVMANAQQNMTRVLGVLRKQFVANHQQQDSKLTKSVLNTTLYSIRHQAIANAKSSNVDDVIIAATFGHISTRTSKKYYGKKRSGWKYMKVKADQDTIEPVLKRVKRKQNSYTASINANLLNTNLFE